MKIFKFEDYIKAENPEPGKIFRPEVLIDTDGAKNLGGIMWLLPPGKQIPYHYHRTRESILIAISGEAAEIVDGNEFSFKAGSVFHIAAVEKHMTINRSDEEFRYLEFYTCPPLTADFVEVT